MKVYVAGKMRGLPDLGFGAFDAARDYLAARNHDVVSPADLDRKAGWVIEYPDGTVDVFAGKFVETDAMRVDFAEILSCQAIALLPGWETSAGAAKERQVAEWAGIPVRYVDPARDYFGPKPHRRLVGLCGYAGSGKDTAAEGLTGTGWRRVAFADPLKELARMLGWNGAKDTYGRRFLQVLGEQVRLIIGEDSWVRAAEKFVDAKPDDVVITDVRYPNEAEWIRRRGGFLVEIQRPGVGPANDHPSERVDLLNAEYELPNVLDPHDVKLRLQSIAA